MNIILLFSYLDFEFFFEEKTDNEVPDKSQSKTCPFIVPPTTIFGSF
jgi:hypothetical protein